MSNSEFNSILNAGARCNGMIDLRSDTVTKPSPEMRRAIYQ
jgi:hypothetical protein